jgi:hypothetical protein
VKHFFYSIGPKIMFGTDSEHFANLRHVKRCKTCVSGLNALFWGTNVAKHRFYSIGPKMLFESVLEDFANLRLVERWKLVFRALTHYFGFQSCEASILLHCIQNDIWECLGALRYPSISKKMKTLCFGPECTILGYESCVASILVYWTQNGICECFRWIH